MLNLKPLNDLVYVRQDELPDKVGAIALPDMSKKHRANRAMRRGVVLAVGPGKLIQEDGRRVPMPVVAGDRVIFMDFAGDTVGKEHDDKLLLMKAEEIYAVEDEEKGVETLVATAAA